MMKYICHVSPLSFQEKEELKLRIFMAINQTNN